MRFSFLAVLLLVAACGSATEPKAVPETPLVVTPQYDEEPCFFINGRWLCYIPYP